MGFQLLLHQSLLVNLRPYPGHGPVLLGFAELWWKGKTIIPALIAINSNNNCTSQMYVMATYDLPESLIEMAVPVAAQLYLCFTNTLPWPFKLSSEVRYQNQLTARTR